MSDCKTSEQPVLRTPQETFERFVQRGDLNGLIDHLNTHPEVRLNLFNQKQFHSLHTAAIAGDLDLLRFLFESHQAIEESMPSCIDIQDWTGLTPLHYTCNEGWEDCAQFLLSKGANLNVPSRDAVCYLAGTKVPIYLAGGRTPLHFAVEKGEMECVQILLNAGARADVADFDGNTPYDIALLLKRREMAKMLAPYPDSTDTMDDDAIQSKKLSDHKMRSKRISAAERTKKAQTSNTSAFRYQTRLHPDIFEMSESFLHVDTIAALTSNDPCQHLKMESPGIYSINMFTPEFCRKLIEECENIEKSGIPLKRPNSMNSYGIILNDIGFQDVISGMIQRCILPFSRKLFPEFGGDYLDSHHSFIVRYKIGEDVDLSSHFDDSQVTLNVCLGKEFQGGSLYFRGIKGQKQTDAFNYEHQLGKTVLHVGKHIHGANKILAGERINLIIWCRNSKMRDLGIPKSPADLIFSPTSDHVMTLIIFHGNSETPENWIQRAANFRGKFPGCKIVLPYFPKTAGKFQVENPDEWLQQGRKIVKRETRGNLDENSIFILGNAEGSALALQCTLEFGQKLGGVILLGTFNLKDFPENSQKSETPFLMSHIDAVEMVKGHSRSVESMSWKDDRSWELVYDFVQNCRK